MSTLMNIGSISKIEIAFYPDIEFSSPDENNIVKVTPEDAFEEFPFTYHTASFSEDEKYVDQGVKYIAKLEWKLPRQSPDNFIIANKYVNKKVIIRATDANGVKFVLGDSQVPVFIKKKRIVPAKPEEFNGYQFYVELQNTHPAYFTA